MNSLMDQMHVKRRAIKMKFLAIILCTALGVMVPTGFVLACSLILDMPIVILIVGIVFGFSATYALSVISEGEGEEAVAMQKRWDVAMPASIICLSAALILSGLYLYISDRPYYLLYKNMPHIAAAMIFLPGALIGCGAILCMLAAYAFATRQQRQEH